VEQRKSAPTSALSYGRRRASPPPRPPPNDGPPGRLSGRRTRMSST
jgi:hypothetical protein